MGPDRQRTLVRDFKGLNDPSLEIAIFHEDGRRIGSLSPVTRVLASNPAILHALTQWRLRTMSNFLTQFSATDERTSQWLERIVLPDDTRILFIVKTHEGQPIGNIGFRSISKTKAELDNVLRGEAGGAPGIMQRSTLAALDWCYRRLGVSEVWLRVFSDNERAVNLYRKIGFSETRRFPLRLSVTEHETIYTVTDSPEDANCDRTLTEMSLGRDVFYQRYQNNPGQPG